MPDQTNLTPVRRGVRPIGRLALLATWRRAAPSGAATEASSRDARELLEEEGFESLTGLRESFLFLPTWGATHDLYRSGDQLVAAMLSKFAFGRTVSFFARFSDGYVIMMGSHPRPFGLDPRAVDARTFHYCPASTDLRESYAYFREMLAHHEARGRKLVPFTDSSDALTVQRDYWLHGPAQLDRLKALTIPVFLVLINAAYLVPWLLH